MLFDLPAGLAAPAIIFRDFPKRHGNIIQKAVGIALEHHPGGITRTAARFAFLSGLQAEVDNFFMSSSGQIHLFETKRDHSKLQEEGVSGRALWAVKEQIENAVLSRTGRKLRKPIEVSYFSYAQECFDGAPLPLQVNIGTKAMPLDIQMPIYSREDMNKLIGPCFGQYLRMVDDEIGIAVAEYAPELRLNRMEAEGVPQQPTHPTVMTAEEDQQFIRIGSQPHEQSLTPGDILES